MSEETPDSHNQRYLEEVQHIGALLTKYEKRSAVEVFGHHSILFGDGSMSTSAGNNGYWRSHTLHPRLIRRIKWRRRLQRLKQLFAKKR